MIGIVAVTYPWTSERYKILQYKQRIYNFINTELDGQNKRRFPSLFNSYALSALPDEAVCGVQWRFVWHIVSFPSCPMLVQLLSICFLVSSQEICLRQPTFVCMMASRLNTLRIRLHSFLSWLYHLRWFCFVMCSMCFWFLSCLFYCLCLLRISLQSLLMS